MSRIIVETLTEGQLGSLGAENDGKVAEARDRRAAEESYWAYSGEDPSVGVIPSTRRAHGDGRQKNLEACSKPCLRPTPECTA
ncbi:hypothetical protein COCON_G00147220 [Conger conger]|uniref:Uncharacterized protein n=1 Tax=Conger conger TaxID=82655 RepID=A0A9Q1HWH8_CONCO|nr:hypothetical protein COCON_G00147220 [Conger conger]